MSGPELAILYILSVLLPAKQKLASPILWMRRLRLKRLSSLSKVSLLVRELGKEREKTTEGRTGFHCWN